MGLSENVQLPWGWGVLSSEAEFSLKLLCRAAGATALWGRGGGPVSGQPEPNVSSALGTRDARGPAPLQASCHTLAHTHCAAQNTLLLHP